ncbi:MAG: hypothetical protein ACKOPQ_14385 [Novosphingobium sp.]
MATAFGHGISLLVHEKIAVIVDQCVNFETFAPDSVIMLHVSASADFSRDDLVAALAQQGCKRCIVNPVSAPSAWGSIIAGHLANIEALAAYCPPEAHISLNASNDMLLRRLPADEGSSGLRFEEREVSATSLWYTGRQFGRSPALRSLFDRIGIDRAIGSQIEGSGYPLGLLTELAGKLRDCGAMLAALPDCSEEVIFPSWARQHLDRARAHPFVLFRSSRLTGLGAAILPRAVRRTPLADLSQKAMNRIEAKTRSPNAHPADVAALIAGQAIAEPGWPHAMANLGPRAFFGIKRVPRHIDDPLRCLIRKHTDAVRNEGHAPQ